MNHVRFSANFYNTVLIKETIQRLFRDSNQLKVVKIISREPGSILFFFVRVKESGVIRAETSAKYPAATCRSRQTAPVDLARSPFPSILQSGGKRFVFSD